MQRLPRPRQAGNAVGDAPGPARDAGPQPPVGGPVQGGRRGSRVRSRFTAAAPLDTGSLPAPLLRAPTPLDTLLTPPATGPADRPSLLRTDRSRGARPAPYGIVPPTATGSQGMVTGPEPGRAGTAEPASTGPADPADPAGAADSTDPADLADPADPADLADPAELADLAIVARAVRADTPAGTPADRPEATGGADPPQDPDDGEPTQQWQPDELIDLSDSPKLITRPDPPRPPVLAPSGPAFVAAVPTPQPGAGHGLVPGFDSGVDLLPAVPPAPAPSAPTRPTADDAISPPRLPELPIAGVLGAVAAIVVLGTGSWSLSVWVPILAILVVGPLAVLSPDDRSASLLRAGLLLAAAAALPSVATASTPAAVLIAVCTAATYPMVLTHRQGRIVLGLAVAALAFPLLADALSEGPAAVGRSLTPAGRDAEGTARLVQLCGILVVLLVGATAVAVRRALAATAALAVQREQAAQDVAARIGRASATDAPSGLPNREALLRATTTALDARTAHDLEPSRDQVAVIMAEIDRFDVIADSLGAALADDIALQVARRLRTGLPRQQLVARLGRHQFGLLLPHATADSCASVARRITRLMDRPIVSSGREFSVTCSVGAALRGPGLKDAGDLLQAADEAARAAAGAGTARWVLFDQAVRAEAHSRASLEIELRDAVRTGAIEAFFQPLVALGRRDGDTGEAGEDRIVGAEALARWIRPDGSSVPPSRFIPMADELGLGCTLGLQLVDLALDALLAWRRAGLHIDQVWVNVSPAQLRDSDLAHDLAARLATRGLPASSMVIEVSAAHLAEGEATQTTLSLLRSLGIAVALDDFGRSGTSLSALRKLPVSAVKLDHVLAAELGRQDAVPRSIAQLCRSLGLRVIVEGVETMMQLRGCRDIDADAVQGFAVARPMPVEDVVSLLAMKLPQTAAPAGRGAPGQYGAQVQR